VSRAGAVVKVLVVCTGNICRSPTAEGVLRKMAAARGLAGRVVVASAGTHDYHVGECPDHRSMDHARRRGYDLSSQRAMQLKPEHFDEYDYILAMDRGHLRMLRNMVPAKARARVAMFLEASERWKDADVPDPYYGGVEGFEQVLDMVEEAAARWLDRIEGELEPGSK
jgi:protein-tyrosine phosphatase